MPPIKSERSASPFPLDMSNNQSAAFGNINIHDSSGDDDYTSEEGEEEEEEDSSADFQEWSGFRVSRSLPRCEEHKYTLRELMTLLHKPDGIDLDPDYQRGVVWNEETQTGLVDTIFQGFYVPSLIFNRRVQVIMGERSHRLICIDGKQRLTSVKRFTDGHIPCHDRSGKRWWFKPVGEKVRQRRQYLPLAAQDAFWKKTFTCIQYIAMREVQEHDLFQRVQKGSPLTLAERARAKSGPWHTLAREFENDYPQILKLSDSSRGRGFDRIISSFAQIVEGQKVAGNGGSGSGGNRNPANVPFRGMGTYTTRFFDAEIDKYPCTTDQQARIRRAFDRFEELARNDPGPFTDADGKATLAPIEFIATAYLIDQYEKQSNAELEQAIRTMRSDVREPHSDNLRRQPKVWKCLLQSMRSSLERKKRPATTDQDQDQDLDHQDTNPRATKRRRGGVYV